MDIEQLLERHWQELLAIREEHCGYILNTKAADREKLENAIARIYRFSGLEPPRQIIWFDSQIEARICIALWIWMHDPFVHALSVDNSSNSALFQNVGRFFEAENQKMMLEFPTLFSSSEEPKLLLSEQFDESFDFQRGTELDDLIFVLATEAKVVSTDPIKISLADRMASLDQFCDYLENPKATTDAIVKHALDAELYEKTNKSFKQELFGAAFSMNLRGIMIAPVNQEITDIFENGMVETLVSAHEKTSSVLQFNRDDWMDLKIKLTNISEDENREFREWLLQKTRGLAALNCSRSAMADSFQSGIHRAVELLVGETVHTAQPLFDAVTAGGWWWPFKDIVFACENPSELHLDSQRRLHNETGMAVRFRDNRGLYALNNVIVSEAVIRKEYSAKDIDSVGAQSPQREVMIRRFGLTRYLQESRAEEIDRDDYGVLYRRCLSDGKSVGIIVTEPVSEFEFNQFSIMVPAEITTATEALEWTTLQSKFLAGIE